MSVSTLTSALVHHSALAPQTCRRHATFIAKRLAISFGALAVAPFFLAFRGAPSGAEILVFACSFAPLAAAVLAARTGRLVAAHAVAAIGLVALSLSLWLGLGSGAGCAIAWLVAALLEALLSENTVLVRLVGAMVGAVLLALVVTTLIGIGPAGAASSFPGVFVALAIAYAAIVAAGAWRLVEAAAPPVTDDAETGTWRAIAGLVDDVVVIADASGAVLRIAAGAAVRLGIDAQDLAGRGLFERVHVADRPLFLTHIADAAHGDTPPPAKIRVRAAIVDVELAPTHLWFEMRVKATGTPREAVVLLRDIDGLQAHDRDVAAAQSAIEDAIEAKDRFLANMSHELRTPLNAIIGFSEMLASRTLRPTDADKQREYARIINQSGQHLLQVVNSTLDMSKIRSGTFALVAEPFEVAPLMDQCCEIVALKADEGRVRIVRDYAGCAPELVGDKRACKQILINLLSNAVKFTPANGEVVVSARTEGDTLFVSVADTGIGIGVADLARLGDPFFQVNSSLSRPYEGTGLGLSVVRGLVGLHGGTIAIASAPDRGTRVDVRLPLDCRSLAPKSPSAPIDTNPRHSTGDLPLARIDRRMKQSA